MSFDNPETVVSRQFQRSELLRSDGRHQLDRIGQLGRATSDIDELSQLETLVCESPCFLEFPRKDRFLGAATLDLVGDRQRIQTLRFVFPISAKSKKSDSKLAAAILLAVGSREARIPKQMRVVQQVDTVRCGHRIRATE